MAIDYKIWNFPKMAIQSQLFHVPGAYFDGGLTSGGARIMSPEPGGRSVLEVTPSLQINEWKSPFSSWLMSKTNGEIFRIPLTVTPQLISSKTYNLMKSKGIVWDNDQSWDNGENWKDDGYYLNSAGVALEGSVKLYVDVRNFNDLIKHGHVIGFENSSYMVDDIEIENNIATITVNPPLRKNVKASDVIYLRPFFLGVISNGSEIRNSYDASNIGAIQLNRIVFQEVIINV